MTGPLLSVQNLSVEFPLAGGIVHAVRNVSFNIIAGEIVGVVGESGCGKTVTSLSILGLISPPGKVASGHIILEGKDIIGMGTKELQQIRGNRVAMIYQDPMTSLNPVLRIGPQIEEAMLVHREYGHQKARERMYELLAQVDVPEPKRRSSNYPHQFSGGMRQRAMIAMGLANHPKLLIADEPTTALDVTIQAQIIALLQELNEEYGMAILLITHNLALVSNLCNRILVMYAGQIVESGQTREVIRSPQHPYTSMLLQAIPKLDIIRETKLTGIDGVPPQLDNLPTGCSFHPRCPYAIQRCSDEDPPLMHVDKEHFALCWIMMRNVPASTAQQVTLTLQQSKRKDVGQPILQTINLNKEFTVDGAFRGKRVLRAVDQVTITIWPGETFGLVGESGSGKSTLARLILLLEQPTSGQLIFKGQDLTKIGSKELREIRQHMQIIFQDPYASLDPRMKIDDIIAEPLENFGMHRDIAQNRVVEVMELCGLSTSMIGRYPHALSGGQRQRVAIARAIALYPDLIVADEPVSSLDVSIQAQIINLLADLQVELSLTYLFISHDLSVVRHLSNKVAVMYFGSIVEIGSVDDVYNRPMHPYTILLLKSIPRILQNTNTLWAPKHIVKGEVPPSINQPAGCPFYTRCPIAETSKCSRERPYLEEMGVGHFVACHFVEKGGLEV